MNENFQKCAQLEIEDLFSNSRNTLGDLLVLQKSIQEDVYKYDFEKMRDKIGDLKKFIDMNEEALRDEDREFQNALTGIHSYPGHWKPWKTDHKKAMDRSFNDLTEEEKLELRYEWIDKLHFLFNEAIAIDMSAKMIFNMYHSKNKHNIERQKKHY